MKLKIVTLSLIILNHPCFSQNMGDFKVSFEFNKNNYSMERLNEFLLDTNYNGTSEGYFDTPPSNKIEKGFGLGLAISYQPLKFQSFGIYGGYQLGKIERQAKIEVSVDPFNPEEKETVIGDYTYEAKAFVAGIATETILDEIFFKDNAGFWKRASWLLELRGGIGYSMLRDKQVWTTSESVVQLQYYRYNSMDFHGSVSMNFDYRFTMSPIISGLGIKVGYQFLKTKNLSNDAGEVIINTNGDVLLNLDFSGIFIGTYLSIGK